MFRYRMCVSTLHVRYLSTCFACVSGTVVWQNQRKTPCTYVDASNCCSGTACLFFSGSAGEPTVLFRTCLPSTLFRVWLCGLEKGLETRLMVMECRLHVIYTGLLC